MDPSRYESYNCECRGVWNTLKDHCVYMSPIICWVLWVMPPCALSFRPHIRLEFLGLKLSFLFVRSCALPPFFLPPLHSSGCHSYDDHGTANQEAGKSKNVVNLGAIRQGMKRFQFLLNCCEPGTIPDASILAAALDLVSGQFRILFIKGKRVPARIKNASYVDNNNQIAKGWLHALHIQNFFFF